MSNLNPLFLLTENPAMTAKGLLSPAAKKAGIKAVTPRAKTLAQKGIGLGAKPVLQAKPQITQGVKKGALKTQKLSSQITPSGTPSIKPSGKPVKNANPVTSTKAVPVGQPYNPSGTPQYPVVPFQKNAVALPTPEGPRTTVATPKPIPGTGWTGNPPPKQPDFKIRSSRRDTVEGARFGRKFANGAAKAEKMMGGFAGSLPKYGLYTGAAVGAPLVVGGAMLGDNS